MFLVLLACAPKDDVRAAPPSPTGDTGTTPVTTPDPCPDGPGSACEPFPITAFPYADAQDTSASPYSRVDAYACSPDTDESGPEWWYSFALTERGVLTASIDEVDGDGVDVDVHLLTAAADCVDRDHVSVQAVLDPGDYRLVLDTFEDQAGPYLLTVTFSPLAGGACATLPTELRMVWSGCDPSVPDCFEADGDVFLATPTVGPVVKEAHLVTDADGFGGAWPSSFTDRIDEHYATSEAATGYAMARAEPWAPAGEGGSEYGQGATGAVLPVVAEAFYVNMYWADRPAAGTRMIVRNPANGRAVVAAAGYETGPGANDAIGGVTEEIHDWLGTGHRDDLELGFAVDPGLPFGPIECD